MDQRNLKGFERDRELGPDFTTEKLRMSTAGQESSASFQPRQEISCPPGCRLLAREMWHASQPPSFAVCLSPSSLEFLCFSAFFFKESLEGGLGGCMAALLSWECKRVKL